MANIAQRTLTIVESWPEISDESIDLVNIANFGYISTELRGLEAELVGNADEVSGKDSLTTDTGGNCELLVISTNLPYSAVW